MWGALPCSCAPKQQSSRITLSLTPF
jgi:hypothetical protein